MDGPARTKLCRLCVVEQHEDLSYSEKHQGEFDLPDSADSNLTKQRSADLFTLQSGR